MRVAGVILGVGCLAPMRRSVVDATFDRGLAYRARNPDKT